MNGTPKKLLWVSRHIPNQEQIDALDALGFSEITVHRTRVNSAKRIKELIEEDKADDVMVVCPWDMLKELIAMGIHPIKSVMSKKEKFVRFERVVSIETGEL